MSIHRAILFCSTPLIVSGVVECLLSHIDLLTSSEVHVSSCQCRLLQVSLHNLLFWTQFVFFSSPSSTMQWVVNGRIINSDNNYALNLNEYPGEARFSWHQISLDLISLKRQFPLTWFDMLTGLPLALTSQNTTSSSQLGSTQGRISIFPGFRASAPKSTTGDVRRIPTTASICFYCRCAIKLCSIHL